MPVQIEFDRVFGGHDVGFRRVQTLQRRVERGCFSRPRRPGHQHHPVRLGDVALEFFEALGLKPELGHVEPQVLFVQQTKHHLFAEYRRQRRDAEIEFARALVESAL